MATLISQGSSCDLFDQLIFGRYKSSKMFMESVLKIENRIGHGSRASVYRISSLADYVLQVSHGIDDDILNSDSVISGIKDSLPELNIGQPVASLYEGKVHILRFQQGQNSGIPFQHFFVKYGIDELLGDDLPMQASDLLPYRIRYIRHLHVISELPQHSYNQLALRILRIQQSGLFVDPCSLNLMVDFKTQTFTTVDHQECIGPYENVLGLVCMLMDTMFVRLDEQAIFKPDLMDRCPLATEIHLMRMRKCILEKALIAAINTGLDWPDEDCPKNAFGFHQSSFDLRYAFRIAGMADQYDETASLFTDLCDKPGEQVAHLLAA